MNTLTKTQPKVVEHMDPDTGELSEVLEQFDPNEAGALTIMGEVNAQVATARRFPRRRAIEIARSIEGLATMTEEIAEECMYSLPRGGKTIEGPSIRFAEIVQQQWGNNRVAAEVGGIDRVNKRIAAVGMYHDLETNSATRVTMFQRISGSDKKGGHIFNDDMIAVAGSAASSKARRNAILAGVPRAVWHGAYLAVRKCIMGDIKTLANRRAAAITEFQRFGIAADQLFGLIDVKDENDITLEHLVTLRGTLSGLKSGEVTVEQLFRQAQSSGEPAKDVTQAPKSTTDALDKFGQENKGATVTDSLAGKAAEATTGAKENGAVTIDATAEKPAGEGQPSQSSKSATTETTTDSPAGDTPKDEGAEKKSGAEGDRAGSPDARVGVVEGEKAKEEKAPDQSARGKALDLAKAQGETARQNNTRRSAVPGEYRKDKELADAWLAGWDGPLGSK